jgi:dihydrofolate reductase
MSKVVYAMMVSLDGFYAGPSGELDWHYADEEHDQYAHGLLSNAGSILFGRVTYQLMANYWPSADPADSSITELMNELPKIVFSSTLQGVSWKNARLVSTDAVQEVANLKAAPGKDLVILGSLMNSGLIDEYQILMCPIALGRGKSLFRDLSDQRKLKLLHSEVRGSGVVELRYRAAD